MAEAEVEAFLSYLSNQRNVAAKTQATVLNALAFLYRHIIQRPLSFEMRFHKAQVATKLPVVLTRDEVQRLLLAIDPKYKLVAQLLYGSGLRLMEAVRLRIKDVDYDYISLMIWQGKGNKNRRVTLAAELLVLLHNQSDLVQQYWLLDRQHPQYSGVCYLTHFRLNIHLRHLNWVGSIYSPLPCLAWIPSLKRLDATILTKPPSEKRLNKQLNWPKFKNR